MNINFYTMNKSLLLCVSPPKKLLESGNRFRRSHCDNVTLRDMILRNYNNADSGLKNEDDELCNISKEDSFESPLNYSRFCQLKYSSSKTSIICS